MLLGGYESAIFADLVAAYILEKLTDIFEDSLFNKIYRNDGIDIKKSTKSPDEICDWLESFQKRVNELTESEYLQFACDIWMPNAPPHLKPRNKKVKINRNESFSIPRHGTILERRRVEISRTFEGEPTAEVFEFRKHSLRCNF